MNWYKNARQEDFGFMKDISSQPIIPEEKTLEYKELENRSIILLKQILGEVSGYKNIVKLLKDYEFSFKKLGNKLIVEVGNQKFSIDNFDKPELRKI